MMIKKYLATIGFAGIIFASCNSSKLDTIPLNSVIEETSYETSQRIDAQLFALYSSLKNGRLYGGRVVIYGDIKADQFLNQTNNSVTGFDVWYANATNSATSIEYLWSQAYLTINRCNLFIKGVDSVGVGNGVITTDVADKYIGEAKLIRALCYSKLLEFFAEPYAYGSGNGNNPGLPLRLTGISEEGHSDLARSSVADVYKQILADLDEAETNLPSKYSTAYNNTTRAHVNTAIALKTRIYLNMQQYDKVITEANKIVTQEAPFSASTGVANALASDIKSVFASPYTSVESIFSMPMTTTSGDYPGTQNGLGYYFSSIGNKEFSLNPNGIMSDASWKDTDARRSFIVSSGTTTISYYLNKYPGASPFTDYVPVIRYSEVLLNLAEALARTTGSVDSRAVALLNAVRHRSDASTTYTTASFSSSSDLISAILKERTIEFLGEGMRNSDLVRLLQTIPAKGGVAAVAPGSSNYIWPIAASELSLNKLMTDN